MWPRLESNRDLELRRLSYYPLYYVANWPANVRKNMAIANKTTIFKQTISMDLHITGQLFIVGGATSGFGKAITQALLAEGASVIAVARGEEKLLEMQAAYPNLEILVTDITKPAAIAALQHLVGNRQVHGIVLNAGGPPAKQTLETTLEDWDNAYQSLLRWKVALTQAFVPNMIKAGYGRLIFIESSSVKQPLENLVLSNSLRVAVVNMVKTLSLEIASSGVTLNVLAPGSHNTPAIERVYQKKSEQLGTDAALVRELAIKAIPVGKLGSSEDFASLALWLLSPQSRYITGQTFSVDGGMVKGIFG
jgi:3-oxoacyl-[acyl-carrier protein] reductase